MLISDNINLVGFTTLFNIDLSKHLEADKITHIQI